MLSPEQAVRRLLDSLKRPARLLVAVSGGSDSLGLLTVLADELGSAAAEGVELFAATIDHGLRPESRDEAAVVAAYCITRGIPHSTLRWEGEKPVTGISAAAREARYALLMQIADQVDASAILTGHTFDDQRETVAMRSARNDDPDNLGLSGMAEAVLLQRRRWLLRPFLSTRRQEIRLNLTRSGIAWIDDPSNIDPHYERVRTRQSLAAEALSIEQEILEAGMRRQRLSDDAASLLRQHAVLQAGVLCRIAPEALRANQEVLRHGLAALASVLGGREHSLRRDSMDRVMAFLSDGLPGRITAGRVIFDLRREGLYMQRENRGLPSVDVSPGTVAIWDGRYRIRNGSSDWVHVRPLAAARGEGEGLFDDVPASIAARAMAVLPQVERGDGMPRPEVDVAPVIAPFERFLPQFDLNLGAVLAHMLRCDDFPPLPIKVSTRKS
jgi:tRNA(Ile)-lysidine synthase